MLMQNSSLVLQFHPYDTAAHRRSWSRSRYATRKVTECARPGSRRLRRGEITLLVGSDGLLRASNGARVQPNSSRTACRPTRDWTVARQPESILRHVGSAGLNGTGGS